MIHIERVYPRESKKIIIWQKLWNWILFVFDQKKIHFFQKWNFLHFCIFWPTKWMCMVWYWFLVNLICIYPIKTGFGAFFHGFAARAPTQTFGPVPGLKSNSKWWYLKGSRSCCFPLTGWPCLLFDVLRSIPGRLISLLFPLQSLWCWLEVLCVLLQMGLFRGVS